MSERRKTVTNYAKAEDLPAQFREGLDPRAEVEVRVTVLQTLAIGPSRPDTGDVPKYLSYWGAAAHLDTSIENAVARVRELRDEWD